MTDVAYLRIPPTEQDVESQLAVIGQHINRTFVDKCRSSHADRPELRKLREFVQKGDVLHVSTIDRLARNLYDFRDLVKEFNSKGVTVQFHDEGLTFTPGESDGSNTMLKLVDALTDFERALIKEKQSEGIEKAKNGRVYKGRKPTHTVDVIQAALDRNGGNKTAAARDLGVSYRTVLRTCQKAGIQ